jgi:hypothetical protein
MEQLIANLAEMGAKNPDGSAVNTLGTTIQALAVSAGGLIGVFTTLGVFFIIIFAADKLKKPE